jgi:hypothetical protein
MFQPTWSSGASKLVLANYYCTSVNEHNYKFYLLVCAHVLHRWVIPLTWFAQLHNSDSLPNII